MIILFGVNVVAIALLRTQLKQHFLTADLRLLRNA
jgi:hypothetical protein